MNLSDHIERQKVRCTKRKIRMNFIFHLLIYGLIELNELIPTVWFLFELDQSLAKKILKDQKSDEGPKIPYFSKFPKFVVYTCFMKLLKVSYFDSVSKTECKNFI